MLFITAIIIDLIVNSIKAIIRIDFRLIIYKNNTYKG
jgi:hypothetical protein